MYSNKNLEINVQNDIVKGYNIGKNYKRSSQKSNDSEEGFKSPGARDPEIYSAKTKPDSDKKQSDEKYGRDSFEKTSAPGSLKFDTKSYLYSDRFGYTATNFDDKKYSIKSDKSESESKKSKRERQIKSPTIAKNDFDEGMNLNSFSCRTIEENVSNKNILMQDKGDYDNMPNKYYKMDYNPRIKTSNKQMKAAFKLYNKNESVISKKYKKNKNRSYCSNEEEKSMTSKKRDSVSGNNSLLNTSSKKQAKATAGDKPKLRSISSASSVKSFQAFNKQQNVGEKLSKASAVKEYDISSQVSKILGGTDSQKLEGESKDITQKIEEKKQNYKNMRTSKAIDDTLSSIYSTIEENSVCNKRHDISVVEADGILDQINSRMMKLHFEMIYKNLDKDDGRVDDFSFEIDNTNNMIVPKNSGDPIKDKNFVQLPYREDLYKENELSNGNLQWVADTQTIRIFPQSPARNHGSVSSPFTSPQTKGRTPGRSMMSPDSIVKSSKASRKDDIRRSMYENQISSHNFYEKSLYVTQNQQDTSQSEIVEIKDHECAQKDKADDLEIERELEYSQNFISIHNPNNSTQIEKSFESRVSEGTESINTNNYSFISGISGGSSISQYVKQGKEKRFINFVREKIHVVEEESIRLYPGLNMQSHLKLYKPSFFSIAYQYPKEPVLENFSKI